MAAAPSNFTAGSIFLTILASTTKIRQAPGRSVVSDPGILAIRAPTVDMPLHQLPDKHQQEREADHEEHLAEPLLVVQQVIAAQAHGRNQVQSAEAQHGRNQFDQDHATHHEKPARGQLSAMGAPITAAR